MNIQIDGINYGKTARSWINTIRPYKQLPIASAAVPDVCYVVKGRWLAIVGTNNKDSKGILALPMADLSAFADELKEIAETYNTR